MVPFQWHFLWCTGIKQGRIVHIEHANQAQRHWVSQSGCFHCSCRLSHKSHKRIWYATQKMHSKSQIIRDDSKQMQQCAFEDLIVTFSYMFLQCYAKLLYNHDRTLKWGQKQSWPFINDLSLTAHKWLWNPSYFIVNRCSSDAET